MAILDELRRAHGLAMLFITHDLDLAAAICDRTVVMYAGQVVEVRRSELLHSDPLHPYTAALGGGPAGHRAEGQPAARHPRPAAVGVRGTSRRVRVRAALRVRRAGLPEAVPEPDRARRRPVAVRAGPPSCAGSWRWRMPDTSCRPPCPGRAADTPS